MAQQPQHAHCVTKTKSDTNHSMVSGPLVARTTTSTSSPRLPTTLTCKNDDLWTARLGQPPLPWPRKTHAVMISTEHADTPRRHQRRNPRGRTVSVTRRAVRTKRAVRVPVASADGELLPLRHRTLQPTYQPTDGRSSHSGDARPERNRHDARVEASSCRFSRADADEKSVFDANERDSE